MDVRPEPFGPSPVVELVAMETRPELGVREGETIGFWCSFCKQADETLGEIVHRGACDLRGRHGRQTYGEDLGPIDTETAGEFRRETGLAAIRWGETDPGLGVHNGSVVAWRCDECGALDETCFEMVHDAACRLAGKEFGPLVG